jgi:inorganic pyrophosphatase
LWHEVDLHVKTWLDEKTGLFRYVNEMPMGTLQKFEVQPDAPQNAIVEDLKSSRRLEAFGQPVPFNYGCFPQTYRDPERVDSIYGAPGDDDPLDVIDLGDHAVEAGAVVQCRPLGAVCLIDDGEADWKVLVVNTEHQGLLAKAQSVEDVERIMPGRIAQAFKWMDDFKQSAGKSTAELQTEIHSADFARSLIDQDHASWLSLVAEASSTGTARGHWIRAPRLPQRKTHRVEAIAA